MTELEQLSDRAIIETQLGMMLQFKELNEELLTLPTAAEKATVLEAMASLMTIVEKCDRMLQRRKGWELEDFVLRRRG